jgi:hypothetical protein
MLNKINKFRDNPRFALSVIFFAVCFVMMHLPLMGIPLGADLTQHLQFASTYQQAILTGDFFPGWAPTDNYGLGSVGIRFYPPIAYYLMAFTQMVTGDWYDTFWTNAFFWMLVGAIGMYLWSRMWLSPIESAGVAIFYSFAPYHRFQIYHFVLFAEFAAAGILPFCFLTLTKVIRRGTLTDTLLFSLSFSLLILTHIPTTILGAIGLAIYGLMMMDRQRFGKTMFHVLGAVGLSLLATAYHWLRLAREMNWVKHTAENFTVEFYDFKQHLFPLKYKADLFTPPVDYAIIFLFLSLLPLLVYVIVRFKTKSAEPDEQQPARAVLLGGFVALFMTTSLSLFIWQNLGVLQKVQFPWRWLSVGYVFGSFAFVLGISKLYRLSRNWNRIVVFVPAIVFSLVFIYFVVETTHSMIPLNRENFATETKGLPERRGCSCWWPNWAQAAALKNREKVTTDDRTVVINQWHSESREFVVEAGTAQKVRTAIFYYPHWEARVNGQLVEIERDPGGAMLIPLGAERSEVRLNFREPLMLQLALAGSLAVWAALIITLLLLYRKKQISDEIR